MPLERAPDLGHLGFDHGCVSRETSPRPPSKQFAASLGPGNVEAELTCHFLPRGRLDSQGLSHLAQRSLVDLGNATLIHAQATTDITHAPVARIVHDDDFAIPLRQDIQCLEYERFCFICLKDPIRVKTLAAGDVGGWKFVIRFSPARKGDDGAQTEKGEMDCVASTDSSPLQALLPRLALRALAPGSPIQRTQGVENSSADSIARVGRKRYSF